MSDVITILKKVGAVLDNDHFVGTSGRHMGVYINKDVLMPHTEDLSEVCQLFAEKYKDADIDVVVGPAIGGILFSTWIAHHLTKLKGKEILSLYTEKTPEGDQVFRRGNDKLVAGKKALIIEDTVTTGGSVMKVVNSVRQAGGEVVDVCVMINKDPEHVNSEALGVPFSSLSTLPVPTYTAEECPLCSSGVPVNTTVGHGKKFLEEKATTGMNA